MKFGIDIDGIMSISQIIPVLKMYAAYNKYIEGNYVDSEIHIVFCSPR